MTQDFNRYIVIDEAAFSRLLQVVELAELMVREQYTHLLSEIEFAQRQVANNTRIFTGSHNVPKCAVDAGFYSRLKDK
ncbi:hypothetical protein [Sodaliphilus pleomorphus]|uniref:hypothetical protein n=1 Tax=Sodaliphilus pleomorphus TaxID=2606626 RepID=UPI0024090C12|nr:hypothetical protein [Sodaliphilus pleomorphus]MDD6688064.1 hypothetical protein [Sodaliphilus pleomorphus]